MTTPDPFPDELVEAAAKALAGEPRCYCPDDWRADPSPRCPFHGDGEWPTYAHYLQARAVLAAVVSLIEQRARLDERERLSSRVHENGWCPTCARDTDEAAMQRLAGKSLESLSRNDLIGLALRNLNAAMDAEARADAAEQRVIDRLAGEAGEPPYEEWNPTRAVWLEAVACGVAAERARWEAKQRQPEAVCDRCGAWKGLRAVGESCNTNCGGRVVAAALAPERTTALRNLEAAMDAEARVREERPIVRFLPGAPLSDDTEFAFIGEETIPFVNARKHEQTVDLARTRTVREIVEALRNAGRTVATGHEAARMIERTFLSPDNPEGNA